MLNWKRALLVLATVLGCIGCDQATKAVASARLPRHDVISLAGDTVRLSYAENRGAFLGLGDQLQESPRAFLFTGVVGVFLVGFAAYLLRSRSLSPNALFACALVCGGGFGNLVDRIARSGYVVDFMQCGVGPVRTGIFNLADVAITVGALMLVLTKRASVVVRS